MTHGYGHGHRSEGRKEGRKGDKTQTPLPSSMLSFQFPEEEKKKPPPFNYYNYKYNSSYLIFIKEYEFSIFFQEELEIGGDLGIL